MGAFLLLLLAARQMFGHDAFLSLPNRLLEEHAAGSDDPLGKVCARFLPARQHILEQSATSLERLP